mgnify:CR=1 FL=1
MFMHQRREGRHADGASGPSGGGAGGTGRDLGWPTRLGTGGPLRCRGCAEAFQTAWTRLSAHIDDLLTDLPDVADRFGSNANRSVS